MRFSVIRWLPPHSSLKLTRTLRYENRGRIKGARSPGIDYCSSCCCQQLEAQARDFEETKARLVPPGEFERVRIRLLEELETPYQARFTQLQQEVEHAREQFYAQRRDNELLLAESGSATAEHARERKELRDSHDAIVAELQSRLSSLQISAQDTSSADRAASLQRECTALQAQVRSLMDELEDVRADKENAVVSRQTELAHQARRLSEEMSAAKLLLAEKETLDRRCRHLEAQVAELSKDESHERQMDSLRSAVEHERKTRQDGETAIQAERNSLNGRLLERERDTAREIAELQHEISTVRARNEQLADALSRQERQFGASLQTHTDEAEIQLCRVAEEKAALATSLDDAQEMLHELQAAHAAQVREGQEQRATSERERHDLQREASSLTDKLSHSEELRLENAKRAATAEEKAAQLREAEVGARHQRADLEAKAVTAETRLRTLEQTATEGGALSRQREEKLIYAKTMLGKEREAAQHRTKSLKTENERLRTKLRTTIDRANRNKGKFEKVVRKMKSQQKALLSQVRAQEGVLLRSSGALAFMDEPEGAGGSTLDDQLKHGGDAADDVDALLEEFDVDEPAGVDSN